jgi:hypothetical protein
MLVRIRKGNWKSKKVGIKMGLDTNKTVTVTATSMATDSTESLARFNTNLSLENSNRYIGITTSSIKGIIRSKDSFLKDFSEYLDELEQAESSLEAEATTTTTSSVPASATSEEAKNA